MCILYLVFEFIGRLSSCLGRTLLATFSLSSVLLPVSLCPFSPFFPVSFPPWNTDLSLLTSSETLTIPLCPQGEAWRCANVSSAPFPVLLVCTWFLCLLFHPGSWNRCYSWITSLTFLPSVPWGCRCLMNCSIQDLFPGPWPSQTADPEKKTGQEDVVCTAQALCSATTGLGAGSS